MANSNQERKRVPKTASSKASKRTAPRKKAKTPMRREVKIFISSFVSLVVILSYYTSLFGIFGSILKNIGFALIGAGAYALPLLVAAYLLHKSIKGSIAPHTSIYLAACGVLICLSLLFTITASEGVADYLGSTGPFRSVALLIEGGVSCSDGGIIGALGIPLKAFFGAVGSKIILIFAMIILAASVYRFLPVIWMVQGIKKLFDIMNENFCQPHDNEAFSEESEDYSNGTPFEQTELDLDDAEPRAKVSKKKNKPEKSNTPSLPEFFKKGEEIKKKEPEKHVSDKDDIKINIVLPADIGDDSFKLSEYEPPVSEVKASADSPADENVTLSVLREKKDPNIAIELTEDDFIEDTKPYEFPPISLLEKNTDRAAASKGTDLREQARVLIETLKSFGVEAKVLEVNKGPTVTRFEIQPSTGVKVSKITGLADDIALNLAALSVRIEAPIPGKAAVGIEIPNQGNSIVRLREVIDSPEFKSFSAKTAFALGKNITGSPIITDIAKMPHALIAGATGSGKSVCINSLITSIIYKADPKEVKFIMIDPKVVELSVYNGIPHLLIPVVTDPRKAAGALNWAVQEMTKRYKMFADNNVRDIKGYNELAQLNGEKKLEQIIIIVDELADLMMVAPRDVEDAICRLAQMARAAGMHLVIATQRPSVDVITGVIKANVPSRIAFAVSSQIDSRTILDMGGAEKLLGKGDMLFLPMGASKPTRIQGAFISDKEVERVVEYVKQSDIKYDEDVLEKIESGVTGEKSSDSTDADELLPQAIEIVVEAGQASASLLQRRLKVGYSRAGRLIDQLEERGIIGPHEGAKPRQVLISRAEYAEMIMQTE